MIVKLTSDLQGQENEIIEVVNTLDDFLTLKRDLNGRDLLIKGDTNCSNEFNAPILEIKVL